MRYAIIYSNGQKYIGKLTSMGELIEAAGPLCSVSCDTRQAHYYSQCTVVRGKLLFCSHCVAIRLLSQQTPPPETLAYRLEEQGWSLSPSPPHPPVNTKPDLKFVE